MLQSCEIVGILPKEEAALTRALYASLLPEQPSKTTTTTAPSSLISSISPSSSSAAPLVITPADRTKSETPDNEHNSTCSRLSSPELSDPDCLSGVGDGGGGAPANLASGSCPSSPQSTNSLHLCLSSSSWLSSDSSISNSSCDSLFLPWSSGSDSKPPPHPKTSKGQAKKLKGPRKKLKRAKRTLGFGESRGSVGAAGRGKVDGGRGKRNGEQCKGKGASVGDVCGDKVPTAKKSACNGGKDANAPIQAQRKFAANHTPPVRLVQCAGDDLPNNNYTCIRYIYGMDQMVP